MDSCKIQILHHGDKVHVLDGVQYHWHGAMIEPKTGKATAHWINNKVIGAYYDDFNEQHIYTPQHKIFGECLQFKFPQW